MLKHPQIHPGGQTKLLRDGQELIGGDQYPIGVRHPQQDFVIAIATQAAYGLNQQDEFVVVERLLQAAHHRDFILQAALQMDGTALLKIFRVIRGE